MAPANDTTPDPRPTVQVKKYANRRLYNTESSSYITLDNLAELIRQGRDFAVSDARTGEDITRSVLTQIIVEEENKTGRAMLPVPFLRQLIGFYGDSVQGVIPRYLEQSMATFAQQQQQVRETMQQTVGSLIPPGLQEMGKQNLAMIERAMGFFAPFRPSVDPAPAAAAFQAAADPATPAGPDAGTPDPSAARLADMQAEIDGLRAQLAARTGPAPATAPARTGKGKPGKG